MDGQESKYAPDDVYCNISQINKTNDTLPVDIYTKRHEPIVAVAQDYEMSIVRFTCSATNIPMFIPTIPDPAFPLTTDMSVTLDFGAGTATSFVNVTANDVIYGIFDFPSFLHKINVAFAAAFVALAPGPPFVNPPVLALDPSSGLIRMYIERDYMLSTIVYWNHNTQRIMNFSISQFNGNNQPDGTDYALDLNLRSAYSMPLAGSRFDFPAQFQTTAQVLVYVQQPYFSLNLWNTVQSITIATNSIPVQAEYIPNNNINQNVNSVSSSLSILSDFAFPKGSSIDDVRPNTITYLPTGEYRMLNLIGGREVQDIQINVFWTDAMGRIFPVLLDPGQSFTMKMYFRRKNRFR